MKVFAPRILSTLVLAGVTLLCSACQHEARAREMEWVQNGTLTPAGKERQRLGLLAFEDGQDAQAYALWHPLAEQGHAESQFNLAVLLHQGRDVPTDHRQSFVWMQKALAGGYAAACHDVGLAYEEGKLVPRDAHRAVDIWLQGAQARDTDCAIDAADALLRGQGGDGGESDARHARVLLTQAATAGNVRAMNRLGSAYLHGHHWPTDYPQAIRWLKMAVDAGSGEAEFNLGVMYDQGLGTERDAKTAFIHYEKAAAQGVPEAMNNLGYAYRWGEGVEQDLGKALLNLRAAYAAGVISAAVNLGDMIFLGLGAAADRASATQFYLAAARAGQPDAQCRLAMQLRNGEGIEANSALAREWAEHAHAQRPDLKCDQRLGDFLRQR
uniref:SEL1-like repeat protein n=1 Tax=Burkholderia arboris TaxID=488730 RepID=UPI003BEEC89A